MEQREFIVEQETAGQRIDRFLSGEDTGLSRSALQALAAAAEKQAVGHRQQRRACGDDQEQLLAAEQAEGHARIEHEPQLHHMGDERHSAYRLQNLHRPQFDQLVNADQRSHSCQIEEYKCH